ncbi:hypothetical protein PRIPAC_78002 [Pristionchus pacificus]|uniref:G protein-coupled receptor n=1 Tax=Pristionchus pacificus TaxID=54126 RepID=A0A2A6CJQ3_PRIPA|nr:hypothetical protein PRIPAC_78002 [Pristionchus pacificus]|eukprot:PDM78273.1 G protein-coupled receptor [Pristionchus pacificus]
MIYAIVDIVNRLKTIQLISQSAIRLQRQLFFTLCLQLRLFSRCYEWTHIGMPERLILRSTKMLRVTPLCTFHRHRSRMAIGTPILTSCFLPLDALVVILSTTDYRREFAKILSPCRSNNNVIAISCIIFPSFSMDSCQLAEQLYHSTNLHALQWVHFICSFISVILCIYTAVKYVHKSLFDSVTKELIIAVYIFCTSHAGALAVLQLAHLISRYSASSPCDAQVPTKLCIVRMMISSSVPGFCILHFGIATQRLQSTFMLSNRIQKITARFFMLIYPCIFGYFTFHNEPMEGLSPYCLSLNKSTVVLMMLNLYAMVGTDIMSACSTLVLWWFNVAMLRRERQEYRLDKTFHRKQNIFAIKQFLPVTIIHTITYIITFFVYSYSTYISQLLSPANTVMPYYCVLAPLTLLVLIRRGKFERTNMLRSFIAPERREVNKDMYFLQLKDQWSPKQKL